MAVWTLADLHLSFSVPKKNMEAFGSSWEKYSQKIEANWKGSISPEDLILIPGDICWAAKFEEALIDLEWIDKLPGTKLILKGNHDYWWASSKKMKESLPPSIHFISNDAFHWKDIAIGGTRLWDTPEYNFDEIVIFQENPFAKKKSEEEFLEEKVLAKKIFEKELVRLRLSLSQLDPKARIRIAMTHYPPISNDLKDSRVSKILEEFKINICVFGHLHNVKKDRPLFGEKNGVLYVFASADYLDFDPLLIVP